MGYKLPNLNWLRSFECAARLRSFTAAAEELHLTQAAISHHVRSLESMLGFRLFLRRSRRLDLTDMGKAYIPSVRKAIEDLAFSTQGLFGPAGRESITVRAPITMAVLWLAPRLKQFRDAHPGITVRLVSEIWADSMADQDVDIDIRLGTGLWPGYRSKRLADETIVPICAPDMIERFRSVADLMQGEMIHILGFEDHWARCLKSAGLQYDPDQIGFSVDTTLAAVECVAAGGGIALVMKRFAEDLVLAGRVAIPVADEFPMEEAHHILQGLPGGPMSQAADQFQTWLWTAYGWNGPATTS